MNMVSLLSRYEAGLLAGAAVFYLMAMLLLWTHLFLRAAEPDEVQAASRCPWRRAATLARLPLCLGAFSHLLALIGQGNALFSLQAGVAGLFSWILVLSYLLFGERLGRKSLGAFVTPVALVAALYSLTAPPLHRFAPTRQLEMQWLGIHVVIILLGYVALAFAFASSLVYLLQEGLLKRKKLSGLWQRLPSLQVADDLIYRATTFGMAMLTLGLITGVLWQALHPDYAALRDPKVFLSLATWLTFALYLGARRWLGWRGRRTNLVVIYGFVLLVILFLGTPHQLQGAEGMATGR